jgi:hypothetical protein
LEENPPKFGNSELSEVQKIFHNGMSSALQQGFDSTAEEVGVYDSAFKPKTFDAKENLFKSKAIEKSTFVSLEEGVRFFPF